MKTLKISFLASLFILSITLNAQNKKGGKSTIEKSNALTEKLDKQVNLSEIQKPKIVTINTNYVKSKKALDDKIKALEIAKKKLKKDRKAKINAVLTEPQRKKLANFKKKKKSKK